jgi:hypothetical protein
MVTVIVPWVLASTVGLLVLLHYFVDIPGLSLVFNGLVEWATIIAAFGLLLGLANVARVHGGRVIRRERDWPYSLVLLLSALGVLVLGLLPGSIGSGSRGVQWVFHYVLEPLATTFFSLMAFFLASAFFRSLRLRNLEAILVTVTAVVVLLGQVPLRLPWPFLEPIARFQEWLLQVPAMAGVRALLLGAGLGAMATAIRVILGLERPYTE